MLRKIAMTVWRHKFDKMVKKHDLCYLFWESTIRCNLNCKHCGSPKESYNDTKELSTEEVKAIFMNIANDFDSSKIEICITGGEPLLRNDLYEIISYQKKLGFKIGVVSNGSLIGEHEANKLRESGIHSVVISVDGIEETHDWFRGKRGAFSKAMKAIKELTKAGIANVQMTTCFSQYNFDQLHDIYDLVRNSELKNWRLLPISPIGRAKTDSRLMLTPVQLKTLLDFIAHKRQEGDIEISFGDEGYLGPKYENEVRPYFFMCFAGIRVGSVLHDGKAAACPNLPRRLIQGDLRKDRFKSVWEEKYDIFRNYDWKKTGKCSGCDQWFYCKGNSLHLWDFDKNETTVCHFSILNKNSD